MTALERRIQAIMRKWRPRLGLGERWTIEVNLYSDASWPKKWRGTVAQIEVSPGYFNAEMHLNVDAVKRDGHSLEHIVLHELVHAPLWPLSVLARDALGDKQESHWRDVMEAATETMTRALLAK